MTAKPRQNLRIMSPLCLIAAGQNRLDLSETSTVEQKIWIAGVQDFSFRKNRHVAKSKCLLRS
jgi:hypothetical protein